MENSLQPLTSNETYSNIIKDASKKIVSALLSNDTYFEDPDQETHHDLRNPTRDSLYVVVPVTIIYVSIFFTGTVGNISTCIVIARNKSMHTATNYYLFSLAVSDLLLLISGLPPEIYMVWSKYPYIFGEGFCVLRGLAAETSTNASVLTITAFTVERYVAICHPFLSHTMSKLSRAIRLILVIWIVALSFALPQALQVGVVRINQDPNLEMCTVKRIIVEHSFELSTFLFFIVPMCLITILYALIGLKLRKSNMMKRNSGSNENSRHQPGRSSRRVLKMLVAVVVAFFICWAPFHVQRLFAIYNTSKDDNINSKWIEFIYLLLTYVSGVLYYVSTTINPILYNIMSNKFRVAFMETLARSCRVPGLAIRHEQRSYSSLSRSQQRTPGAYGSRTPGTGGTGFAHESTECSGNSGKDESPQQTTSNGEQMPDRSSLEKLSETNDKKNTKKSEKMKRILKKTTKHPTHYFEYDRNRNDDKNSNNGYLNKMNRDENNAKNEGRIEGEKKCQKNRKLTTVNVTNFDSSTTKKWWRFIKWLPGFKSLKFPGTSYAMPENRVLDDLENHREEFSMTIWNENGDQRPV